MGNKALILFMYLIAVYLIVKRWYKHGSGLPYPTTITAPSYLYGVLALTADFTGGLSTVLAVGLTFGLYQRLKNPNATLPIKDGTNVPPSGPRGPSGGNRPPAKAPAGPKGPGTR